MREIEVGCKIPENGGMEGFGDEEVANLIAQGWRVVSIKSKGALMRICLRSTVKRNGASSASP